MSNLYSFTPTYPIQEAIDLALAVKANPDDYLRHAKHGCGLLGCILEKHDSEPNVVGAAGPKLITASGVLYGEALGHYTNGNVDGLCDLIVSEGRACSDLATGAVGADPAEMSGLLLYAVQLLIQLLLKRFVA